VVAINRDLTREELGFIQSQCEAYGVKAIETPVWGQGGEGGKELAEEVVRLCDAPSNFSFCYQSEQSITEKIEAVCKKIYRADGVELTPAAKKQAAQLEKLGFGNLPVCMAKTQYSFSDNAALLAAPEGFKVSVRSLKVSAGAGFIVVLTGEIMTMPGLPRIPAAEKIDVDSSGKITGLF
jgi:formate--tetrahydrofolate ligase